MSFDTQSLNDQRQDLSAYDELWIFGYGSLIYKVDFDYISKQSAHITGFERRFWQGSDDHRGTPEKPGRVVTLTKVNNARCFGIAYQVSAETFKHLDYREKNGYLRHEVTLAFEEGNTQQGLIYIASPDNEAFLGDDTIEALAIHISESEGPSGKNSDYVYQLAEALRGFEEYDEHVFAIEKCLKHLATL